MTDAINMTLPGDTLAHLDPFQPISIAARWSLETSRLARSGHPYPKATDPGAWLSLRSVRARINEYLDAE